MRGFGPAQALAYATTLTEALAALANGPDIIGTKARDDVAVGIRTLHVAGDKRRGRHIILFRVDRNADHPVIEVLRLLHDAMDFKRHLRPDEAGDVEK